MKNASRQRMITASEVGEYIFCAKAWKLKIDGARPESPRLEEGTNYHTEHQSKVHLSQTLSRVGKRIVWIALLAAVVWLVIKIWL